MTPAFNLLPEPEVLAELKARDAMRKRAGWDVRYGWPAFTSLGCYTLAYYSDDSEVICANCMNSEAEIHFAGDRDGWRIDAADVYWEGPRQHCVHCNAAIDSSYGDPDCDGCGGNGGLAGANCPMCGG